MKTGWYTLDRAETALWNHLSEDLRIKYRRMLFAAAVYRARAKSPTVETILLFDAEENLIARHHTLAAPGRLGHDKSAD